jgi:hypothetical protein
MSKIAHASEASEFEAEPVLGLRRTAHLID